MRCPGLPLALAALLLSSSCVVAPLPPPPLAARAVAVSFDDALGPHGQWVVIANLGRAWRPHAHVVGVDFVPYFTGGWWVLTQHGWVFETDWPWGWATFHYGRWYYDPFEHWVWIPGDTWGPAWVDWRWSSGYVGWVPLGPPGIELVVPAYRPRWCFVEVRHFAHHEVWRYRVDEEHVRHTATPVRQQRGPDRELVERESGVPVRITNVGPRPPPGQVIPPPRTERRPPAERERERRPPPVVTPPPPAPPQRFERPREPSPAPPARRYERPPAPTPPPAVTPPRKPPPVPGDHKPVKKPPLAS